MKTTSLFQAFDLDSGYSSSDRALIVRPPQSMRVFRCLIYVSGQVDEGTGASAYIANEANANVLNSVFLSRSVATSSTNPVPPDPSTSDSLTNVDRIQFDRRGVGYMNDTFYIFGKGTICFVWEGEVN